MKDLSASNSTQPNKADQTELNADSSKINTSRSSSIASKFSSIGVKIKSLPVSPCEQVKEFRGNLIANVSHDLRTPLQSIQGYAETLKMKGDKISKEEQQNYLEIILKSTNKLSSMIDQFFEYSKLDVSQVIPQKTTFPLMKIVQDLEQNYDLIAKQKNIDLNIEIGDELPSIHADFMMIYRVFQNLTDNALKFTPEHGKVFISLAKYSDEKLRVQISDSGSGIPQEDLENIFIQFQTNKKTATKKNDGMGLGLAIVRQILDLHNSTIFAQSEVGVGSTFTFFLPFVNK